MGLLIIKKRGISAEKFLDVIDTTEELLQAFSFGFVILAQNTRPTFRKGLYKKGMYDDINGFRMVKTSDFAIASFHRYPKGDAKDIKKWHIPPFRITAEHGDLTSAIDGEYALFLEEYPFQIESMTVPKDPDKYFRAFGNNHVAVNLLYRNHKKAIDMMPGLCSRDRLVLTDLRGKGDYYIKNESAWPRHLGLLFSNEDAVRAIRAEERMLDFDNDVPEGQRPVHRSLGLGITFKKSAIKHTINMFQKDIYLKRKSMFNCPEVYVISRYDHTFGSVSLLSLNTYKEIHFTVDDMLSTFDLYFKKKLHYENETIMDRGGNSV